jgi:signal transduction histidine kinase/DNA-binding response OmpR family regulator
LLEKEYELAHKENENNALAKENEIRKIQASADRTTRIALGTTLVFFVLLAVTTASGYYRTKTKNTQLSQQKSEIEQANVLITQQAEQLKEAANTKSKFFANVSHELRTPVTLVNGMLEMMQQGSPEGKWRDRLDIALANSRRLQTLVNEVLDLVKPGTEQAVINKKQVTLLPLLNRIIYSFESLLVKKSIRLEVQLSALKDLQLPLDEDKFEKIINNLIYNAIKFNREGGWIKVEGRLSASTERVMIEVSDSGTGIPESEQPYVFERFYQSSTTETENGQGLGIGLSLVKELTLLHGGDVSLRSKLNEGSVFTVSLPTKGEDLAADTEDETLPAEAIQLFPGKYDKTPAILLVEDNAEMRYYLREILGDRVTTHETANGSEALVWLKTNTPDLIISDVMMPEMDGYEFLSQLKSDAALRSIPVVMLTARASEEDRLQGLRLGVDDYIVKPFNAQELKIRMHNLLTNQLIRRQWQEKPAEPEELLPSPTTNEIFIKKVAQLVESRASDATLGVPDLAEHLALSERQLYRTTGSLTGMTPAQLIKEIRLKIAFKLLMDKKVTKVSALAAQVGFDNSAYFSQQFLARFGKRPVEFL